MNNQVRILMCGCLLLTAGCGSTLPLVFVDKTNVGLEISGPNPAEGTSGSIALGYNTRSAAVVPIAVKRKTDNSTETALDTPSRQTLENSIAKLDASIKTLRTDPSTNSDAIAEAVKEKENLTKILISTSSSYDLVTSTKGNDKDALSVLGQFTIDSNATKNGVGVGLGRFFATGSAASRLADGFAAKLGTKQVIVKANDDAYDLEAGKELTGISLHANDLVPANSQTKIRVPANHGLAEIASASGILTYKPEDGFKNGEDAFSYAITDQSGNTSSARVVITVKATAPDIKTPKADDKAFEVPKNVKSGELPLLDGSPDVSNLMAKITKQPTLGTADVTPKLGLIYTPNTDATGTDILKYKFTDKKDGNPSNEATITLTIK